MVAEFFVRSCFRAARLSVAGFASFVTLVLMIAIEPVRAASYTWSTASGDWSVASNWGGTAPGESDGAYIANGGTATVTQFDSATCGTLSLGNNAASGAVQMTGGSLVGPNFEFVGDSGVGTFTQSGGENYG